MGLSRNWGELVCFWINVLSLIVFFFCARRFNFVTENYSSYHLYRKLLIISPGQYNFARGFGRACKPGKVTRRGLISGGLIPGCICLFFRRTPPHPPPIRVVYRDRPITGEVDKSVSVCVLSRGGGGGGAYKRKFMVFETVKHSQFKDQRTET